MNPYDHLTQAVDYLNELSILQELPTCDMDNIGEMLAKGLVLQWYALDEDNPPVGNVLALGVWSKGPSHRYGFMGSRESRQAVFYQPFYGNYDWTFKDGKRQELVFFLDHGNGDEDDEDDWVPAPRWYAQIATPQELDLEK